jgi:hypothetical protein
MKLRVTMSVDFKIEDPEDADEALKRQKVFFDRNPHRIMQLADLEDNYTFKVERVCPAT